MPDRQKLRVDVVSDVMCPWCYIGKVNLDNAMKSVPELDFEVFWRPYQLDPTLPKEGKDRAEYLNAKFGGEEGAKNVYTRIEQAGKALGIDFDFAGIPVSPNTLDAHRVIRWAGGQGSDAQDRAVTRLFELYFLENANIGNDNVLLDVAEHAGLDTDLVGNLLAGDADRAQVSAEIEDARQKGITGVPCFIVDGKFAVMGAQPADTLAQAFRQVAVEKSEQAQYTTDQ